MGEVFYIADTHYGHKNVMAFDGRPFNTTEEHDNALTNNWNEVVGFNDDVYILGDFSWYSSTKSIEILKGLNGTKHLIVGNHDGRMLKNPDARKEFAEVVPYKEIKVNDSVQLVLCHYPIPTFNGHFRNWVHFYGHVHTTFEYDMIEDFRRDMIARGNPCRMYNIGAMMPWMNFTPRTFDEIISLSEHWLGE